MVKDHSVIISGLLDDTEYQFLVKGMDKYGNVAVSDIQHYTTPFDTRPAKIENFDIEYRVVGAGRTAVVNLIVSWQTDEPTTTQVEWGPGLKFTYPNKTPKDTTLKTNHIVVIRDLRPESIYYARAVVQDKANNTTKSNPISFVTPQAPKSALDLVLDVFEDYFGWTLRLFR